MTQNVAAGGRASIAPPADAATVARAAGLRQGDNISEATIYIFVPFTINVRAASQFAPAGGRGAIYFSYRTTGKIVTGAQLKFYACLSRVVF